MLANLCRTACAIIVALFAHSVQASSITSTGATCSSPMKRPSWHDLTDTDKNAYLAATQCLFASPAKTKLPGVKTRWDDLAALHQIHALQIHSTGVFLPYHRYFLHVHKFLLSECGYAAAIPYWDESRDAGNFSASPVLSTTHGFGGTGSGTDACVTNGPFANTTVNIGPNFTSRPRCLNRRITDFMSFLTGKAFVDAALNHTTYLTAQDGIYSGPHLMGHASLLMMNGDSITSAGDPLFMLHHGFVDKMWADWQSMNSSRLTEIGGLNAQDPAVGFTEFPGNMTEEAQWFGWGTPPPEILAVTPDPTNGDGGGNVTTLGHVLSSLGIIPNATVKDIMDTKGPYLCYEYM